MNYPDNIQEKVKELAAEYSPKIYRFLRDMIRIPSLSCDEEKVVLRIKEEMEEVGFDEVTIDGMGNIIGRMGNGPHIIAMDAHIDTVDVGNRSNWSVDPFEGAEDENTITGRGGSDQEGGMASMVYGAKIMKDLNLLDEVTVLITGTVMEEDCDGLCWQYLIDEVGLKPEFVVITEPTSLGIYRGQRGRMEIFVEVSGISCHGSAPERGDNAIFKMAPILQELEKLHERLHFDPFLGKGSLTVSEIFFSSPSRCAVADSCRVSIDRRLTHGETPESAIKEIEDLPSIIQAKAKVDVYDYSREAYTGLTYPTKCIFPTWVIEEDHIATRTLVETYNTLYGTKPTSDKWTFSTNGVSIMGKYGIPCIGFGPGHEDQAHAPNEKTYKDELTKACEVYSLVPMHYMKLLPPRNQEEI